jgi:hypothetical protein
MGTAVRDRRAVGQRNRAGLVVRRKRRVGLRVGVDERHELPAVGAALAHIDFVVAQQNLGVDHLAAMGADAARQLMEDVIGIGAPRIGGRAPGVGYESFIHDIPAPAA